MMCAAWWVTEDAKAAPCKLAVCTFHTIFARARARARARVVIFVRLSRTNTEIADGILVRLSRTNIEIADGICVRLSRTNIELGDERNKKWNHKRTVNVIACERSIYGIVTDPSI